MKNKIIAVDFDGTLCLNNYPEIGAPRLDVIERLIKEQQAGARVILWTCRRGPYLMAAIYWALDHGIEFNAVNENLPEIIEQFGGDTRKIYADEYWDDRAALPFERKATPAAALDILKTIDARIAMNKYNAEHYGPFLAEGVEAKIRTEEAEKLRAFIKIILEGHDIIASERD